MTMTPVKETHIYLDENGTACVDSPRLKVKMLVESVRVHGGIEAVLAMYPHLTRAQLHAAMSYYYDHQKEMDEIIGRDKEFVEKFQAENPEAPITRRLREAGKLP